MSHPDGATLRLRAYAKVNYALEVGRVRPDGYHDIRSVMQSVSLFDEVEIERGASDDLELIVEPEGAETGDPRQNTVRRAWEALRDLGGRSLPVKVRLKKRIPSGSGLGGASADAAAMLVGLDELFSLGLGASGAREIGARIGADVPFCVSGGTALAEGVGEELRPLPSPPDHRLVISRPEHGASTAAIYGGYDKLPKLDEFYVELVAGALKAGDLPELARTAGNALAPVTKSLVPEVEEYERRLRDAGALGAAMSGSGTAVFGIFDSWAAAKEAEQSLGASFGGVYEPVPCGVEKV
ncbi:MAG: 4-(cytidine 5'-diphospho)-2-C-methyl-D-erythritol kinase [Rubrobacter sp.]|nr:4-(cytidine 5'-diphospho)-2-C-methyl-D-erythritol kinase [Rubrobacter sp.]